MEHPPPSSPQNPNENPNPPEPERVDGDAEGAEREYSCSYCDMKFRSKQALGGHQNDHKMEKAIQKNAHNLQSPFGYFAGVGLPYTPTMGPVLPIVGAYQRPFQAPQIPLQHPGIQLGFNPRQAMQPIPRVAVPSPRIVVLPPPARPQPGLNNPFRGTAPVRRNAVPFMGSDSSSATGNQGFENLQSFGSRVHQGGGFSPKAPRNDADDHPDIDDSGLDLSLKL
ncbi:zinc finger protein KNUCKLES-like [Andrographis paniculata]|uniref:zinc finger protein KNUCKLES-like n=1 Tax=Andrographis paniculata TaxID=175694 RepID=UPI0021E812F5|nr:zinc finger protein KNUCKLES-like [Andrographis paniculata]